MQSIAIIGSGICGLTIANALKDTKAEVTVYDKGRRPGGRAASRTIASCVFDHGAPAVPNEVAKHFVADTKLTNEQWLLDKSSAYCPIGGVSNFGRDIADGLKVQQSTTILGCQRNGEDFVLSLAEARSIASIDTLILTAPPLQSAAIIQEIEPTLGEELRETCRMSPAWVVLFKIADRFRRENYVFVPSEIITKVRHERTKPGRKNLSQGSWFVAECSSEWSVENLERSPEWVSMTVLEALRADLGENFPVESSLAHRWRYASTQDPIGSKYLHNDNRSVWITGDWCLGNGIQSAHTSGLSVVNELRTDMGHNSFH
jgi:renalase